MNMLSERPKFTGIPGAPNGEWFRPEHLKHMEDQYSKVTAQAAADTHWLILDLHSNNNGAPLSQETIGKWKELIDGGSKNTMSRVLHSIPFLTISVGSEGDKEACYTGVAAPSLKGEFGQNGFGYPTRHKVSDVVEGTDFAVNNLPGSSSVLAVTVPGGIMPTPEGRKYMMKLIAPPQAKGIMSLDQDHELNLRNLLKALDLEKHPEMLTQVTLNTFDEKGKVKKERSVNQKFIDAARKVGVNLMLIDHGDFVPGVKAALNPALGNKPMIVIGRSGFEEATMDAAAAMALGGFAEAQEYNVLPKDKDGNFQFELGKFLSHKVLVPADRDQIFVSISSITGDNEHFNMPRVRRHESGNGSVVRTLLVTHKGIAQRDLVAA